MDNEKVDVTTVLRETLLDGLATVFPAVSSTSTLPVLGNVLLRRKGDSLELAATDMETIIQTWVSASGPGDWETTVPAKQFKEMISLLDGDIVELMADQKFSHLRLSTKMCKAKFNCISADEFPTYLEIGRDAADGANVISFDGEQLAEMIDQVVYATSVDVTKAQVLHSVFVVLENGEVKMAATDGFRMAEKRVEKGNGDEYKLILHRTPMRLVSKLAKASKIVEMESHSRGNDEKLVTFRFDGRIALTSHPINATFPDYERAVPEKYETVAELPAERLLTAAKLGQIFVRGGSGGVVISVDVVTERLTIEGETFEGDGEQVVEAQIEGNEQSPIKVSAAFVIDALKHMKGSIVRIGLNGQAEPFVMKCEDLGQISVIMPMKYRQDN